MASHIRNTFVALAVCTSTMVAWQGGLAAVGLKDANVLEIAKSYFLSGDSGASRPVFAFRFDAHAVEE